MNQKSAKVLLQEFKTFCLHLNGDTEILILLITLIFNLEIEYMLIRQLQTS